MLLCFFISLFIIPASNSLTLNNRPIIGIVTEEVKSQFDPNATSFISASYVKYLESSGARVVPIWIEKPKAYYEDFMSKINGVLFPGGAMLIESEGYGRTGKIIFDIAVEMNNKGDYFPIWGTCLGFEMLNFLVAKKEWIKACSGRDLATNLNFEKGFEDSRIFKDLGGTLKTIMETQNITYHYHQWCLTPKNYSLSGLNKFFKVLATNKDFNGNPFVSVVEAYKYPFYGVAFHPEKIMFEWVYSETHHNIPHSAEAVAVSQYFSRFFIDEARKSKHQFPSTEDENEVLIYNYNPIFVGKKKNHAIMQNYYFD